MCLVALWSARIPGPFSFAEHHWLVIGDGPAAQRWEVWQSPHAGGTSWGHLHRDLKPPEAGVGNGPGRLLQRWHGPVATELAERLAASPRTYPWCGTYRLWPGPNSNTYAQWMLGGLYRLGWRAFGKGYAARRPAAP